MAFSNRMGKLIISSAEFEQYGSDKIMEIFGLVALEILFFEYSEDNSSTVFSGTCPLFAPLYEGEIVPYYSMKVDFSKHEPTIEMFRTSKPLGTIGGENECSGVQSNGR
jgi:hypothetical protein